VFRGCEEQFEVASREPIVRVSEREKLRICPGDADVACFAGTCSIRRDDLEARIDPGGALEDLLDRQAPQDLLRAVNRKDEFIQQQRAYMPTAPEL
jgi:hypothetical protein